MPQVHGEIKDLRDANRSSRTIVLENKSLKITGQLVDEDNANITLSALQTLTMTLLNWADDSVINGLSNENILNASIGTVSSTGFVTIKLRAADNPIIGSLTKDQKQLHLLKINFTWNDGVETRSGGSDYTFFVRKR